MQNVGLGFTAVEAVAFWGSGSQPLSNDKPFNYASSNCGPTLCRGWLKLLQKAK